METQEIGKDFKEININIDKTIQEERNQLYIGDLMKIKPVVTTVPTFIPRKFIDQIQFVLDSGTYYLYIYCSDTTPGTWKKVTLT